MTEEVLEKQVLQSTCSTAPPRDSSTCQLPAKALGVSASHVWKAGHRRKEITPALLHAGVLTSWKQRFYLPLYLTAGGGYAAGFASTPEV